MEKKRILITGVAGFIGSHLYKRLVDMGHEVIGIDNMNSHLYQRHLKNQRAGYFNLNYFERDCRDRVLWANTFDSSYEAILDETARAKAMMDERDGNGGVTSTYDYVFHLAAHAGVRDSFGQEREYNSNNIDGTQRLIDYVKSLPENQKPTIIYASTSSVYGGTPISETGWKEDFVQAHQLNAYAYTKYVNECQFKMSGLKNVGLRFFTVYGPWGRPDMALFSFTRKILAGQEIDVYNYGDMKRDFTYIDDIIDGLVITMQSYEEGKIENGDIFNIGRGQQVNLLDFIEQIEVNTKLKAKMNLCAKHPADTTETWSNTEKLQALGYEPKVSIAEGVGKFYEWYQEWIPKLGKLSNDPTEDREEVDAGLVGTHAIIGMEER